MVSEPMDLTFEKTWGYSDLNITVVIFTCCSWHIVAWQTAHNSTTATPKLFWIFGSFLEYGKGGTTFPASLLGGGDDEQEEKDHGDDNADGEDNEDDGHDEDQQWWTNAMTTHPVVGNTLI